MKVISSDEVIAVASSTVLSLLSPITSEQISHAQREDAEITCTVREIACEEEVTAPSFKKVRSQLLLSDGVLCRNLKLPLEGVVMFLLSLVCCKRKLCALHTPTPAMHRGRPFMIFVAVNATFLISLPPARRT